MPKSIQFPRLALAVIIALCPAIAAAQSLASTPHFRPVEPIAADSSGPVIRAHTEALKPFTVAGEHGVILGQQDGTFESWLLPVKVLSHFTIEANVEGYSVPIDVNQQSAEIEVHPDRTVITYAHIAFSVRQIMFSPSTTPPGTGPIVLFEFDCLHPTEFTFRFTPNLEFMWPMRNEGVPGIEWVAPHAPIEAGDSAEENETSGRATSGYYVLHSDYPDLAAAVTIPGATAGILAPYQERPQVHPVELKLKIDPARDRDRLYPLLMVLGTRRANATTDDLGRMLQNLNRNIGTFYQGHRDSYRKLLANSVSIETPDKSLNQAFQWAVVSIEQLKAKPWAPDSARSSPHDTGTAKEKPPQIAGEDETGLVAGYYASGDSARPGFGWFFGRDALYTLYAVNGYGDFSLARSELEFLIHRQRADGKIMHEYSQTAPAIDWQQFPYMYAAADSTPLFLLAMLDYVRSSGDLDFLKANRDAIEKAWAFETAHADTNGIYDNRQGTGWVESWPGGMPHQEIYLALLDQEASAAMAQIERLFQNLSKVHEANRRAEDTAAAINSEFYDQEKGCYAFSRNADGSLDRTSTVYPALAWWSGAALNRAQTLFTVDRPHEIEIPARESILEHPEACLQQLASHTLNTDWGLRDVSNEEKIYDGMSYHQGSVWPLFTGWAALAEYRGNQPLAGYQMLMENANLTGAQDLGAVTELLSGDFLVPFGRSTSHQLWSSAMVITPILRGLFGIDVDATTKTITVNPHLPAYWDHSAIRHISVPGGSFDLTLSRDGMSLHVGLSSVPADQGWRLRSGIPGSKPGKDNETGIVIPVPLVEVADSAPDSPVPGARTSKFRVTREVREANKLTITAEGIAGSTADLRVRRQKLVKLHLDVANGLSAQADSHNPGASLSAIDAALRDANLPFVLEFRFPPGEGWKTITVTLTW